MSPLWRDRLHVVLCPTRLILVRFGRGLRPSVAARAVVGCDVDTFPGTAAWVPALAALEQLLAERQWQHAEVRVILSNHFVHYLMVDWDAKLTGAEEQLAMVRYSFSQVFGDAAGGWDFRWHEGRPPAPCLAGAIDHGLLAGLRELFTSGGRHLHLGGVQPYLMTAFNHWRREIDPERDWFLLAEPGRLCLAWFRDGEWAGLHSQQTDANWGRDLPQILARALLQAGVTDRPARLAIHAPEAPEGSLVLAEEWSGSLLRLPPSPGFEPANDAVYAMAMNT